MITAKVLTTPQAPEQAVLAGMASILKTAGIEAQEIDLLIHGTTLATNAIIERKGARTALVTTEGFRDVLAMRNESRYDQYDLNIVLPEPLVPRHLRFTVPERLDRLGRVLRPLDEQAVRDLIPRLRQEEVESIAVGFLHAFVNAAHERRVAELLAEAMPDVPISLSSEVSPEMREWERFSTTAANAYVQPMMARYLRRLERGMREMGLHAPIFLMLSGGKLTTIETACRFPIRHGGKRSGGGRDIFGDDRARGRARARAVIRHGRDHRESLPDRRFQAADLAQFRGRADRQVAQRVRIAAAHSGDRDGRDRRGRWQHRQRGCRWGGSRWGRKARARRRGRPPMVVAAPRRR